MSAFNPGDLVRVSGCDDLGRCLDGMTGVIVSVSPLYAHVRLTSWPGEVVRVEREPLTLISAREIRSEPVVVEEEPVVSVPPAPKPRVVSVAPRVVSVAPRDTVYPEPEYREAAPRSRLREKLRGMTE